MFYEFGKKNDFIKVLSKSEKEIILYGAGFYGSIMGDYLNNNNIAWKGYVDSNKSKVGNNVNNKKVYSLDDINVTKSLFIICSIYQRKPIEEILNSYGVADKYIIQFQTHTLFDMIIYEKEWRDDYSNRLLKLKEKRINKRCFIIGNGPSLRVEDLDVLRHEDCMATNAIYRAYNKTEWRPKYYFIQDPYTIPEIQKDGELGIKAFEDSMYLMCSIKVKKSISQKKQIRKDKIFYYPLCEEQKIRELPSFSENILSKVYWGGSTVYSMLQVAVWLGYKEIYLLGMDLGFANTIDVEGNISSKGQYNYMASFLRRDEDIVGTYYEDRIIAGYESAKNYMNKSKRFIIYNSTNGGFLEVFERKSLEDIIGE